MGATVAYLGSFRNVSQLNLDEILGPLIFWYAVLLLIFAFPLRDIFRTSCRALRTKAGTFIFWPYLALHLFVYGFLLEAILVGIYGMTFALSPSVTAVTDVFSPPSVVNTLLDLSYSPSATFTLPPVLSGAFSLYGVCVAIVIAVLVVANVVGVQELGRLRTASQTAAAFVVLPATGVILGASCCLSVPALVALVFPTIARSTSFQWVYSITYFFFPAFAGAVLYVNARSIRKIATRIGGEESLERQKFRNSFGKNSDHCLLPRGSRLDSDRDRTRPRSRRPSGS